MAIKILELDIETSPHIVYAWDLWQPFISIDKIVKAGSTLCWSAKWHGKREVMFDSVMKSSFKDMIKRIHGLVGEADAIVHYNGSKFDMPTLNREFILQGLNPPAPYANIDLYKTIRKNFKFPSYKLAYVVQALGIGEKIETAGMPLWTACMDREEGAWRTMETYNKRDVRLLEPLYDRLLPWIPHHPNVSLYARIDGDLHCTRCHGTKLRAEGNAYTEVGVFKRYQCKECGKWLQGRTNLRTKKVDPNLLKDAKVK